MNVKRRASVAKALKFKSDILLRNSFKSMSTEMKKERIKHLWSMARKYVHAHLWVIRTRKETMRRHLG